MGSHPLARALVAVALLICCAGCGGSKQSTPPKPQPPAPPSDGTPVTGTERMGWDQEVSPGVAASALEFGAYVDNFRVQLADVSCVPQSGSSYQCSARLPEMTPGRHELRLTYFEQVNGAKTETAKSTPLVVVKVGTSAGGVAPPNEDRVAGEQASRAAQRSATAEALPGGAAGQFAVEPVAETSGSIADLAVSNDGTVFAAERCGRVLLVSRGGATGTAAELNDVETSDARGLFSIALHPEFGTNRLVYLAYAAQTSRGPVYRLARGREVGGRIGQLEVLLDAAPAAPGSWAILRFGPDRRLYALLGEDRERGSSAGSYSGKLLRLNDDGTRPADNPESSPVLGAVPGTPAGLVWTESGAILIQFVNHGAHEIWSTGTERGTRVFTWEAGRRPAALAYVAEGAHAEREYLYAGVLDGGVRRLAWPPLPADDSRSAEIGFAAEYGAVRAVAAAPDGAVYFGTANIDVRGTRSTPVLRDFVVRLAPRQALDRE